MINIKSKEYNLTTIFQYDLLRDILLSLAEAQNDILSEITVLKNQNNLQDIRLSHLEGKNNLQISPTEFNFNATNIEHSKNVENINNIQNQLRDEKQNKEEEIKKDIETINEKKIDKKEIETNNERKDDIKEKENGKDIKDIKEINDNENTSEEEYKKKTTIKKNKKKLDSRFKNIINDNNNSNNNNNNNNIANYSLNNSPQSPKNSELNIELIRDMLKNIRENSEKIANFESGIDKHIEKQLKKAKNLFQKELKNEILDNKSNITNIDNRVNEILQITSEHDKLIDDLTVKSSNFDVFKKFQDSGDGTVDMAKLLIQSLEERVMKKFEIIDLKHKQEALETLRSKKAVENLNSIGEKNAREINDLKESEKKLLEEIENLNNLIQRNEEKNKELFNEGENNQNQKLEELKNELKQNIKDIEGRINEKIFTLSKDKPKIVEKKEENVIKQNKYDDEKINDLEKKFGDLKKKTNDLDNAFKLFTKELNIDEIKKNINNIKLELEQKITEEALKELYNLHLNAKEETGLLRDLVTSVDEDGKKNAKNITTLANKVESVVGNLITLKEKIIGSQKSFLELSKYVENEKFNESNKKYNGKFDKIFEELDILNRDLTELKLLNKDLEIKERIDRLEEDVYNQINERKNNSIKIKNDLLRQIKALEVQIKALNEEMKQKQDADSWILAKQPMKCFNCATCEANIKNEIPSEEYVSWNKYPSSNKNGRGFSHMLQMMTSNLINNIDEKTNSINNKKEQIFIPLEQEGVNSKSNLINSSSNINNTNLNENNKNAFQNKIATIERSPNNLLNKINKRENGQSSVPKNYGKLKLPKMYEVNKKLRQEDSVPLFDEEKNNLNINNETINSYDNEALSPKIIKITKKHGNKNFINFYSNSPSKINYNVKSNIKPPSAKRINYKIADNNINKNFSQTIPIP